MNPVGLLSASYVASNSVRRSPLFAVTLGGWLVDIDWLLLARDEETRHQIGRVMQRARTK